MKYKMPCGQRVTILRNAPTIKKEKAQLNIKLLYKDLYDVLYELHEYDSDVNIARTKLEKIIVDLKPWL